ncbi:PTS mannose/fructose/sorbose/N-acetylgalactosamine transporter subunit IIC [Vagococcus elongatus]|uniref:PTS sugar transporter n=1 Tax=Vagococcus elongatus TaxID=180344 RepID=A0A430AT73_9ENTE|nr:PTS sugar transporter subunit IIC [Vagococcus elongatus]RSU11255.1 hypothetical protein CBF29_08075 [Vagococcus elongatus]
MKEAFLVGLIMFIGMFSDNGMGDPMIKRPLVMSMLVGLVLGDLETGIKMGASLELVFLGVTGIGGTLPSDSMVGAIFGTAFAILSNSGSEIALALAVPIGILSVFIRNLLFVISSSLMPMVDGFIEKGQDKKVSLFQIGVALSYSLTYFVIGFLGISLGSSAVQSIVDAIPQNVMDALTVVSQILPALGLAILLNMLWEKKIAVFLLLGFVLAAYLEMPVIAIALIAAVFAIYTAFKDLDLKKDLESRTAVNTDLSVEEEFFDE